jgi:hypothetical protein
METFDAIAPLLEHFTLIFHEEIPGLVNGGIMALFHRAPGPACGRGRVPLARTFGMETREDAVQFRRRTLVSGIIDRSVVNRPPPQKTVLILVGGQSVRARPVRSGWLSCLGWREFRGPPPAGRGRAPRSPPPGAMPTTAHCLGEAGDTPRSPELVQELVQGFLPHASGRRSAPEPVKIR